MKATREDARRLMHDGALALSRVEENGIRIDVDRLERTIAKVGSRIKELDEELKKTDVWREWKKTFGGKSLLGSRQQLVEVLKKMGHKLSGERTRSGVRERADREVLERLDLPFVRRFLELEKLKKLHGTYLLGIRKEVVDGLLHPFFNLHTVLTYRSSSDRPNFQNIPIRDKLIGKLIRRCFVPRDGHVLMEVDFKQLEVSISACVVGSTLVQTADGPMAIEDVVESVRVGRRVFVHGYDEDVGQIVPALVLDGGMTRERAEVWRMELDNGRVVDATPDHRFMLREGGFAPLIDLLPGTVLFPNLKVKRARFLGFFDVFNLNVERVHNYCLEAGVVAKNCYHRDPRMIEYLETGYDLHKAMAAELYLLDEDQVTSEARYCAKNKFVFPQFYGSYYARCAPALWEAVDAMKLTTKDSVGLKEHMASRGITALGDVSPGRDGGRRTITGNTFMEHVRRVEQRFWGERFKVYSEWKERWWRQYLDRGWFELLTGFREDGIYSRNDVINHPVQGSAFHCLLWTLIETVKWMARNKMRSMVVGQIHDSMLCDVHRSELDDVVAKVRELATERLPEVWRWIIVPLAVDVEVAEENWFEKVEVTTLPAKAGSFSGYARSTGLR